MLGRTALVLGLIVAAAAPGTAHAYLDPASGSIILQAVLGGIAGVGLLLKLYWHKLLKLFGVGKAEEEPSDLLARDEPGDL